MSDMTIKLGETYTDEMTGFAGIATAIDIDAPANVLVQLETPTGDDGDIASFWCAPQRLVGPRIPVSALPLGLAFGQTYAEALHGRTGVATRLTRYLTGCDRVELSHVVAGALKTFIVDITQLIALDATDEPDPGGPGPVPPSPSSR
jgi:hypothetical protein